MAQKTIKSGAAFMPLTVSFIKDPDSRKYQGVISVGIILIYMVVGSRAMVLRSLKLILSEGKVMPK